MSTMSESLGLEVRGECGIHATPLDYPWIDYTSLKVPGMIITLQDEVTFAYGSLVGRNTTSRKLASKVPQEDSDSTQQSLFRGLPDVLQGRPHQDIAKVENVQVTNKTLFTASKNLRRSPSMIFAIDNDDVVDWGTGLPAVIRLGVCQPKDLPRLLGTFGIKQAFGSRRKS